MILVVDDHPDSCRMLIRLLGTYGMDAQCISDPRQALLAAMSLRPDCVILDDNMPELTGLDVLKAIRHSPALDTLPVIIYSASGQLRRQEEAKRLGAAAWVTKGTPFEELLRQIPMHLRRQAGDMASALTPLRF